MNDEQKKLIQKEIDEYIDGPTHRSINGLKQRLSDDKVAIEKLKQEIIQIEDYVKKLKEGLE